MVDHSPAIKSFYRSYHDAIAHKRFNSPFRLRRHVHRANLVAIISHVPPGSAVIDVGAGDGVLAGTLIGERSDVPFVVAVDLSEPNIRTGQDAARASGLADRMSFVLADAEQLPFRDGAVPTVISSHCLEHLPSFDTGCRELRRVARDRAIVGLPTCLTPAAWCLLGGDDFWKTGRRTPFAWLIGLVRVIANLRNDGVDETYGGRHDIPHVWFYPWAVRRRLRSAGFVIERYEAPSLPLPYFGSTRVGLRLERRLELGRRLPILRVCGYGCVAVAVPAPNGHDEA